MQRYSMGSRSVSLAVASIGLSMCLVCELGADEVKDHRVEVKIGKTVTVATPEVGVSRAMMSMARDSDGSIYLATQNVLFKSNDNGSTWIVIPVHLASPPSQSINGLGVTRGGRLLLSHQNIGEENGLYGQSLYVSYSDDGGVTWTLSETDFRKFSPGTPNIHFHEDGCRTFIEKRDGTLMFTTTVCPTKEYLKKYPPTSPPGPPNFMYGGKPGDLFSDLIFRSTDGGVIWSDATTVYPDLNPHESSLAIDPHDGDHILIMTRVQRSLRPDEDAEQMMKITGNPQPRYKQGALFESTDGGRTFQLAQGGLTSWYGHRGSIYWAGNDVLVITHQKNPGDGTPAHDGTLVARISLNGGTTWIDGTREGTPFMNKSTKFLLASHKALTAPTVSISPNHFLTAYFHGESAVSAVLWRLDGR